jgi:hypothetical protein
MEEVRKCTGINIKYKQVINFNYLNYESCLGPTHTQIKTKTSPAPPIVPSTFSFRSDLRAL